MNIVIRPLHQLARVALVLAVSFAAINISQPALAQAPAADAARAHKVALIDMAVIFKQYKKFEVLREDLKAEIEQSEVKAKEMATNLQALQQKMKSFKEGSPEFSATEKQLATSSAEFEAFRRSAQREFLKKESEIYHTVYLEVTDAVAKYAQYYKYTLVLRFSSEELDRDNPQGLIQGMNRQVVYFEAENDITQPVLKYLNQKFTGAAGAAAPRAAEATRPGTSR
ncbi:outer membrane chaperone Skp (OmpH) [Planctopirus limnophila DSM 3776]|uniref:Outer membrane chaperone Skp (OmpH) n=1 Tax=Planctopirus limnophila (strain ATCC 43296 / DSM 3776 / IFAM 1008 / Mu 290) TaxID=521674 RepID=D5SSL6_PLAL2|nr:OmpH family outer membrane protein [Planctopirus limnophila]ADG66764.1 outer membrane chaperone Skp (OmpH) [Planctopirus limnophila DSM 3776]